MAHGLGWWAASLRSAAWRIVCTRTQALGSYDGVIATSDSESATTWTSWATDLQGDASGTNRVQTRRRMIRVCFSRFLRFLTSVAIVSALNAAGDTPDRSAVFVPSVSARVRWPHPWDRSAEGNFPRRGEKSPRRRRCGHTDFLIHDEIASVVVAWSSRGRWHMCCPAGDHDDQHDDEHAWATTQN